MHTFFSCEYARLYMKHTRIILIFTAVRNNPFKKNSTICMRRSKYYEYHEKEFCVVVTDLINTTNIMERNASRINLTFCTSRLQEKTN